MKQFETLRKPHRLTDLPLRVIAPNESRRTVAALENRLRAARAEAAEAGYSQARFHAIVQQEIRSAARGKKGQSRR